MDKVDEYLLNGFKHTQSEKRNNQVRLKSKSPNPVYP